MSKRNLSGRKNIIKDRGSTAQYIVYTFFTVCTIFTDYTIYNVLLLILLFVVACVPKYFSGRFRMLLETAVELLNRMWRDWSVLVIPLIDFYDY